MKRFPFFAPGKTAALALSVTITAASFLSGCSLGNSDRPSVAETESPPNSNYEQYKENQLQEQARFDEFTDELFYDTVTSSLLTLHFTIADPAAYAIEDYSCTYGDATLSGIQKNLMDMKAARTELDGFDQSLLTEDQSLTLDILKTYLDTELTAEGLELYATPFMPYTGIQAELPVLLAEYAFRSRQDISDYLTLLAETDEYFDQLLTFEEERSRAGLFCSDSAVDHIVESCQPYIIDPQYHILHTSFVSRLEDMPDLTAEEKEGYIQQNLTILEEHFIPAYENLANGLTALKGTGLYEGGLCSYPEGKEYYEYLVHSYSGTSYSSITDLKNAIEQSVNNEIASMSVIIQSRPEILDELDSIAFSPTDPSEILQCLKQEIQQEFPEIPEHSCSIKYVDPELSDILSPAMYLTPPLDQYNSNIIYLNLDDDQSLNQSLFTTLAHEGYPGHLYQNVYFINTDPSPIRLLLSFNGYSEGWGLYSERLSYLFNNGADPDASRLLMHNFSASIGLNAVLDLNINYFGWTKEQVYDYLSRYYDVENSDIADSLYSLLTENPGYYVKYYAGYMEILELRELAENTLGSRFDAKEFHQFLLDIGPAPFSVIRSRMEAWLFTQGIRTSRVRPYAGLALSAFPVNKNCCRTNN